MNTNQNIEHDDSKIMRLLMAVLLVFIIAFSNIGAFSILATVDADKIENLAEGESDIDFEEKEKNSEVEEDSFLNSHFKRYCISENELYNDQYLGRLTIYHLKIPTPPPDLKLV